MTDGRGKGATLLSKAKKKVYPFVAQPLCLCIRTIEFNRMSRICRASQDTQLPSESTSGAPIDKQPHGLVE